MTALPKLILTWEPVGKVLEQVKYTDDFQCQLISVPWPSIFIVCEIVDAEALKREEEAIKIDGLNVAQMKELRDKSEKFAFQAEVNRMMKLIINSLYRNKEVSWINIFFFLHISD